MSLPKFSPPPIGFIRLREAVARTRAQILFDGDPRQLIAEACESGRLVAAYRSLLGVEDLDRSEWRKPNWRNYFFGRGLITLVLPLLDGDLRPTGRGTARCEREIFVRRDSFDIFLKSLSPAQAMKKRHPVSSIAVKEFVRSYVADNQSATMDGTREAARIAGISGHRPMIDDTYRAEIKKRGEPVRPGRRRKSAAE